MMLLWLLGILMLLPFLFFIWIHTAPLQQGREEAIAILGYKSDGNRLHPLLLERLTVALKLIQAHSYRKVIVLGGKVGTSSATEAELMAQYLVQQGIDRDRIILDNDSRDTIENFINCKAILEREGIRTCVAVSNSFHIRRMQMVANAINLKVSFYAERNWRSLMKQVYWTLHEMKLFVITRRLLKRKVR